MEDVPDIKRSQAVIGLDSKTRDIRRTIPVDSSTIDTNASSVEQVIGISQYFGKSVRRKEVQATFELFFHLGLQGVVVADTFCVGLAAAPAEVREWNACVAGKI